VAINPEGQVPVLDHDGHIITHTSVIGEYLEDAFPDAPALRPADALGKSRMRYWNKFCDEHVLNYVSMHGWHRMVSVIARSVDAGEFEKLMQRVPLHEQREKWRSARSGFGEAELANATRKIEVAVDKVEQQLRKTPWLAGDSYTLADINFFASGGMALDRLFPQLNIGTRAPQLTQWVARVSARPGVKAAFAMPNRTHPALRTFTGEAH
jgi:glutathione S-transferase